MKVFLTIGFLLLFAIAASAQTAANDPWPGDRRRPDEESEFLKKMLAKQQTAREKKEYAELIEKGETALKMSEQLEKAFAKNEQLSGDDLKRLEEFEKIIGKIRDELLNREIFYSLKEAQVLIEEWRRYYNTKRPHSSLGYKPPAPETFTPKPIGIANNLVAL